MRLIDADAINPMRCPKSISEMREWINEQPTVCDIEQIRADIEQTAKDYDKFADYRRVRGLWIALEIIDKHIKAEMESEDV